MYTVFHPISASTQFLESVEDMEFTAVITMVFPVLALVILYYINVRGIFPTVFSLPRYILTTRPSANGWDTASESELPDLDSGIFTDDPTAPEDSPPSSPSSSSASILPIGVARNGQDYQMHVRIR
ncbi:hypothetical protein VTN96DRAFT_4959 [Rasamsonia emersonii]